MGNTVVQKPSEYTHAVQPRPRRGTNEVLPEGVLGNGTGAGDVGDAIVRDKRIGKVMFTGSVKTGMKVVQASAGNLSRLTLELGGNDAGIVLPDVDPEKIAEGLFWGAFINNGQTCAALKRLYVPNAIYDQVIDALAAFAAKMPTGVGLDEGSALGPLQNQMQWNVVDRLVEDAKARGARVVMGGDLDTASPATSTRRPWSRISATTRRWSRRSSSARRCRSSGTPTLSRRSSGRTGLTSASAPRCGRPTETRPRRSRPALRQARSGSTATAASTRWSRSAAPSIPATAWSSASRASSPSPFRR